MKEQQEISKQNQEKRLGERCEVLIENISFDGKYFVGRTMQDVPDIDGLVYVKNDGERKVEELLNKFVECEITGISEYDLIAKFK